MRSDDTKPMDQLYVWHQKGKVDGIPKAKHGGGSVLLWECYITAATDKLDCVTGIMNSLTYQVILTKKCG